MKIWLQVKFFDNINRFEVIERAFDRKTFQQFDFLSSKEFINL